MTDIARFGRAELHPAERQLLIDGVAVPLGARAFDVLSTLVAHHGRVVSKDELLAAAWPGLVVEENNLQVQISALRKLLGTGAIATIPGQGYQFTAALDDGESVLPIPAPAPGVEEAREPHEADTAPPPVAPGRWSWRMTIAVSLLAMAAIAVGTCSHTRTPAQGSAGGAPAGSSIAVLPFADLSEKKDQEYFSDGLSESLIDQLTQIPNLRVPARTSSFYFKGRSEDITQIASKLRVAHVLEGSVRKSGNTIRVTAQLIRADNGYHVWSETFERNLTDIFTVQDEIANSVVGALRLTMLPGSGQPEPAPASIDAYTLLLQGRFAAARSSAIDMRRAVDLFEQSVRLDPNYAPAWSEIASARRWLADYADPAPDENVARARAAVQKALALNPNLVQAHIVLAVIHQNYDFDWGKTEAEIDTAVRLEPNGVPALALQGFRSYVSGDLDTAIPRLTAVLDRDPFNAGNYRFLALALSASGSLEEAERMMRRGLELSPRMEAGHFTLTRILLARHAFAEAVAAAQQESVSLYRRTALAVAYQRAGREAEARAQLAELIERDAAGAAYQIAEVQAALGEREAALQWLERAYRQHDSGLIGMKIDALVRDLRQEPRFKEVMKKVGLPP